MENLAIESFGTVWAISGAAVSAILGGVGSAIGSGIAGQAASGLVAEKPDLFGKAMVLEALPGSQGIYGLIGAFLILKLLKIFDPAVAISTVQGMNIFFAALPLGITALFSGIYQGKVSAAGMNIIAKNAEGFGSAMILAAIVETFAILGLLVSILAIFDIKSALGV